MVSKLHHGKRDSLSANRGHFLYALDRIRSPATNLSSPKVGKRLFVSRHLCKSFCLHLHLTISESRESQPCKLANNGPLQTTFCQQTPLLTFLSSSAFWRALNQERASHAYKLQNSSQKSCIQITFCLPCKNTDYYWLVIRAQNSCSERKMSLQPGGINLSTESSVSLFLWV